MMSVHQKNSTEEHKLIDHKNSLAAKYVACPPLGDWQLQFSSFQCLHILNISTAYLQVAATLMSNSFQTLFKNRKEKGGKLLPKKKGKKGTRSPGERHK